MRKLAWAGSIIVAFIFVLLLGLSLFVKSYLKNEKLKTLIIPRVEQLTGRKMKIEQIQVSLFRGIMVKGIALKERDGEKDFLGAKEFILDYSLIPLLRKQLVITRIDLVSPYVSLRRESDGRYNFDDIIEKSKEQKGPTGSEGEKGQEFPLSIITDRITIRDAKVEFSDMMKELPDITAQEDIDLSVTAGKSLKDAAVSGSVDLKDLKATMNGTETNTSGKVEMNRNVIQMDLSTRIGNDTVKFSGMVKDYLDAPAVLLNISSRELNLERLMALGGGKKVEKAVVQKKGQLAEKASQGGKSRKAERITGAGAVTVDSAVYKGYSIQGLGLKYRYQDDVLRIGPFQMRFSGGDQVKSAGVFKGNMQFRYPSESPDMVSGIKKSLAGKGTLDLTRCEVKQSKITDSIALITGLNDLRTLRFDNGQFQFTIGDQKIFLQGSMNSTNVILNPAGTVGFEEEVNILTDLKLSPTLAAKLPTARFTAYLKDERGWSVVPLKITGTEEKPSVTVNAAALQKQIGKGIQRELERQLLGEPPKSSSEQPGGKSTPDIFKGIFGK